MSSMDDTLGTVMKLATAAEALAGLVARLRADVEGIELDPDVAAGLDAVVERLGVDVAALSHEERGRVAMSARALLAQAADLAADPGRAPGWAFEDPIVLMSTGRLSANIANVIARIAPSLDGLQAALQRDGATFLDVGAGVAALSISLCETWPGLRVVASSRGPPRWRWLRLTSSRATSRIASTCAPSVSRTYRRVRRSTSRGWPARSCRRRSSRRRWPASARR